MKQSLDFLLADEAEDFLREAFGDVCFEEVEGGYTCALPGFFKINHIPTKGDKRREDEHLTTLHTLKGVGFTKEGSALSLANRVVSEEAVVKHMPKAQNIFTPRIGVDYKTIGNRNLLHKHDSPRLLDFNLMGVLVEGSGVMLIGDADDNFGETHMHLIPAKNLF